MKRIVNFFFKHAHVSVIFIFIAIIFIRNLAFWSTDRSFIFGDSSTFALHLTTLANNLFTLFDAKKSILLWSPYFYAPGIPSLSIIDSGWFYPPNWIIVVLIRISGATLLSFPLYTIFTFFHIAIGSIFIYYLLLKFWKTDLNSSLLGALMWAGIGFNTEFVVAAPVLIAGSYLPICTYFLLNWRKTHKSIWYAGYFIALAFSLLIGYPIVSIIVYVVSLVISLLFETRIEMKTIVSYIKTHAIGLFFITLPLIFPLYFSVAMNLPYSIRSSLSLAGFITNSAAPTNIIESILPHNIPLTTETSTDIYLYFSLVGLIILIRSKGAFLKDKKNFILLGIGILGIIMSLGQTTSLAYLMYFLLPGVNLFRRLAVFSLIPGFIFCILVALSLKDAVLNKVLSRVELLFLYFLGVLFLISQALIIVNIKLILPTLNLDPLVQSITLILIIITLTLFALKAQDFSPKVLLIFCIVVLAIEYGTNVGSKITLNSHINPGLFFKESTLISELKKTIQPGERVDLGATQYTYNTDYVNLEQLSGYLSLGSRYSAAINASFNDPGYKSNTLKKILGMKYKVDYYDQGPNENGDPIVTVPNLPAKSAEIYHNINNQWQPEPVGTKFIIRSIKDTLPRLFLAFVHPAPQDETILKTIEASLPVDAYVSSKNSVEGTSTGGYITIDEYQRNYIKATVKTYAPLSFVANSTAYYPGWTVKINGKTAPLVQTNWFMMGVYVPEGNNVVEFQYVPYGLFISVMYLLLCSGLWLVTPVRKIITN